MPRITPISLPRVGTIEELRREVEISFNRLRDFLATGGKLKEPLDANSNRVRNLPSPTSPDEPATKAYVDAHLNKVKEEVAAIPPASIASSTTPTPDPVAPHSPTISIVDHGNQFGITMGWSLPADIGGTVGYNCEVRYYNDVSLIVPVTDWMYLSDITEGTTITTVTGPWPRPAVDQWVKGRVRGVNADNTPTAWVETSSAAKVDHTAQNVPPTQPPTADITLSYTTGRDEQLGENIATISASVVNLSSDVAWITMCIAESATSQYTSPALSSYRDVGVNEPKAATPPTIARYIVKRKDATQRYWILMTSSSNTYQMTPTSTTNAKYIDIPPVSVPGQPTGFLVQVIPVTSGGLPEGRLKYTLTPPVGDLEYFTSEFERIKTDASFNPLPGEVWKFQGSAVETIEIPETFAYPSATEYYQYRATAVSRAFDSTGERIKNLIGRPTSNVTVPASGGVTKVSVAATPTTIQIDTTNGFKVTNGTYVSDLNSGFLTMVGGTYYGTLTPYSFYLSDGSVIIQGVATGSGAALSVAPTYNASEINTANYKVNGTTVIDYARNATFKYIYSQEGGAFLANTSLYPTLTVTQLSNAAGALAIQVVGKVNMPAPAYANNAAAVAAGLSAGTVYCVTGTDPRYLAIVY